MKIPQVKYELYYNDSKFNSVTKSKYVKGKKFISIVGPVGVYVPTTKLKKYTAKEQVYEKNKLDVISIFYTDYLNGQMDELDIEVSDPTQKWIRNWTPEQNDTISGQISLDGKILDIQEFYIDEISYKVYPNIITIKCLSGSVPKDGQLRKRRYDKYKETTLQSVVSGIAQRNNLVLQWNGEDITLLSLHSNGRSDLKLISDLAKNNGFYSKIFTKVKKKKSGTEKTKYLIFQDLKSGQLNVSWEGEQVAATGGTGQRYITITDDDILEGGSFTLESFFEDRKDHRKYKPYDEKLDKFRAYNAKKQGYDAGTTRSRYSDGPIKDNAKNEALESLLEGSKGSLPLAGNPDIVAGSVIYFDSRTSFRGTYLIWEVSHSVKNDSGWTTTITSMKRLSDADLPKPPVYHSTPQRSSDAHRFGQTVGINTEYNRKNPMPKPTPIAPVTSLF